MAVSNYDAIFEAAGREWDVDPRILKAIAQQESGGKPDAVSKAGARGVMQIMPDTGKELGVDDFENPEQSIYGGAKYLSQLFDQYKNTALALAAYNAGPKRVDDYIAGKRALPAETLAYVPAVSAHFQKIAAPAQTAATKEGQPLILGDSLAVGMGGNGRVGAAPKAILDSINAMPDDQIKGRQIVLSGGASNDPAQTNLVYEQVRALQKKGASGITLVGVGDRPDFVESGVNGQLASIAGRTGANFSPISPDLLGPDRVHPKSYAPLIAAATSHPASNEVSDDDFLKQTGATASPAAVEAPKIEEDDAFLSRTGAVVQPPAQAPDSAPGAASDEVPQITAEQGMVPETPAGASNTPIVRAAQRIAGAVEEGYKASPPILTPAAEAAIGAGGPMGRYIVNPLAKAAGGVLAAGAGAFRGAQQTVNELGDAVSPGLGRDLAGAMEAAPFIGRDVPIVRGPQSAAPRPRFVQEYYGEGTPANPLAAPGPALNPAAAPFPNFVPPGTPVPVLPRILELLRADDRVAANRPQFIPPGEPQPRNPLSASPAPRAVPPSIVPGEANPLARPASPNPFMAGQDRPAFMPPGEPQPQSVGASSRDTSQGPLPARTAGEQRADLMKSVTQTAEDRAGPQGVDHEVYVPGVQRTLASREFSPQNAVDEKVLRETDPAFDKALKKVEKENNDVMVDYFTQQAGDPIAVERLEAARDELTPPALKLFENEKAVDAAPVLKAIDDILAGPAGKRSSVVSVLKDVRDKLFDKDGNLESMPSQLYGARQNITDKLKSASKGTSDEASNARLAKVELQNVLGQLDPVIGQGAKGFEAYLKDFSEASKPIDAMNYLQSFLTGPGKITDGQGYLRYNQVQKMLEKIAKDRASRGPSPAKSLTEDQIQRLVAIRNELAANAYKDRLAATKGSDTLQKTNTAGKLASGPLGTAVKHAATLGAHVLMGVSPIAGYGNALLSGYQNVVRPTNEARKAAQRAAEINARKQQLLGTGAPNSGP